MDDDKLNKIAAEAVKIHKDFPEMSYHWCLTKAKEVIAYENNNKRNTSIK